MLAWGNLIVIHLKNVNLSCWAKMIELPFIRKGECAYGLLDLIHEDICGLMSIHTRC